MQVVDPQCLRPGLLAGRLAVEELYVVVHAPGVVDAGGQAPQCVRVALLAQVTPRRSNRAALAQNIIRHDHRRATVNLQQPLDALDEVMLLTGSVSPPPLWQADFLEHGPGPVDWQVGGGVTEDGLKGQVFVALQGGVDE